LSVTMLFKLLRELRLRRPVTRRPAYCVSSLTAGKQHFWKFHPSR